MGNIDKSTSNDWSSSEAEQEQDEIKSAFFDRVIAEGGCPEEADAMFDGEWHSLKDYRAHEKARR